jgi:hypothetical protein
LLGALAHTTGTFAVCNRRRKTKIPSIRVYFHFGKGKNHLVELGASVGTFLIHLQSKGNPDPEGKKGVPFRRECVACHPPVLDRVPHL